MQPGKQAGSAAAGAVQADPVRPLRILIVDDDAMISGLLAQFLIDIGHVVCGIETTEAGAVRAAERERPDLIIADVTLHDGSGMRAVEQILRTGPVAHVFISGNRLPTRYHALMKPFRPAELLQAMGRALAFAELNAGATMPQEMKANLPKS